MGAGASFGVTLRASDIVDMQFFLMDAARRDTSSGAGLVDADAVLSSAAALDYVLLLSSQSGDEPLEAADPVARSVVETLTRAATCALDIVDAMMRAPAPSFAEFASRQLRRGGILDIVRSLRENGVVDRDVVGFRELTLTSDIAERRARKGR